MKILLKKRQHWHLNISHGKHVDLPISEQFPETTFVVDSTVQIISIPVGEFQDKKDYFSGKHHIYCIKSQVITDVK